MPPHFMCMHMALLTSSRPLETRFLMTLASHVILLIATLIVLKMPLARNGGANPGDTLSHTLKGIISCDLQSRA